MAELKNVPNGVLIGGHYRIEKALEEAGTSALYLAQPDEPGSRAVIVEVMPADSPGASVRR